MANLICPLDKVGGWCYNEQKRGARKGGLQNARKVQTHILFDKRRDICDIFGQQGLVAHNIRARNGIFGK